MEWLINLRCFSIGFVNSNILRNARWGHHFNGGCYAYSATPCCACSRFGLLALHRAGPRSRSHVRCLLTATHAHSARRVRRFRWRSMSWTPGGEVTAIDSAGFGPITITQSVTITSPNGVEAGIVPTAGGDAV